MKRFVDEWVLTLRRVGLRGVFLRLAVLLLPWQARYFIEGPEMGGFSWEQGRWSIYASMLVMVAVGLLQTGWAPALVGAVRRRIWKEASVVALALLMGVVFILPTLSWNATSQGIAQVALLASFVFIVYRNEPFRDRLPFWIVLSLVPVAMFALGQTLFQFVPAFKWLGVALQDPSVRGVSVIEVGAERFLRAYGSFPHPNILGGWMAFGVLLSAREWLAREGRRWGWLAATVVFTLALYASFSRSAWLACVAGMCVLAGQARKQNVLKRMFVIAFVLVGVVGSAVALKPELVLTRLNTKQRLEIKSVNERSASIIQSFNVIKAYPFGTGFEAYRVGLDRVCAGRGCVVPAEPPHFAPLLALAELGWVRMSGLLAVLGYVLWKRKDWRKIDILFLAPVLVLAAFDHYLWSLWAGQGLVALFVAIGARDRGVDKRVIAPYDRSIGGLHHDG